MHTPGLKLDRRIKKIDLSGKCQSFYSIFFSGRREVLPSLSISSCLPPLQICYPVVGTDSHLKFIQQIAQDRYEKIYVCLSA